MRQEFDPWAGKILQKRKCQPTPLFLPGESRGQKNLRGYSPWGLKDTTEQLSLIASVELCQQADAICHNTQTANQREALASGMDFFSFF